MSNQTATDSSALFSELLLLSAPGPDDNSDLEPLLQFLSSERGGGANSSPSFPSVTLFLSSFRSVLLNLLHQRFGFAFDSFVLPLSFSSSLFVAVSGAAFAGTGSVHLGGGAFLRSHPDLAIWSVFSWMQQEYFLLPLAPLHHMNYVVTDIVDVEASLQKYTIQSLAASDAVPASTFG